MLALEDLPLDVVIAADELEMRGTLTVPRHARGLVIVAHPLSYGYHRPLTRALQLHGMATLRCDLTTTHDRQAHTPATIAARLRILVAWLRAHPLVAHQPIGLVGIGAFAAPALTAAAHEPLIEAVVTCGQNEELLAPLLPAIDSPSLLIVDEVPGDRLLWRDALQHRIVATPPPTGRANDPSLARIVRLADQWLAAYLQPAPAPRSLATAA